MPGFRVHHLVELEFAEARGWYAERSPVAGENFAVRFDAALDRIERIPRHTPVGVRFFAAFAFAIFLISSSFTVIVGPPPCWPSFTATVTQTMSLRLPAAVSLTSCDP